MGKLGFVLSVIMISVAVTSLIINIHLYAVNKQLNAELSEIEFQMYGYIHAYSAFKDYGFEDETREHGWAVWNEIKYLDEAQFVISEKNFSMIVYIHPYRVGFFNPSIAEWVVILSSTPETTTDETKIAIFRLDYQTRSFKKAYKFSYPVDHVHTKEESIAIMKEEIHTRMHVDIHVYEESVRLLGGNYIYSYGDGDTIIVNRYAGMVIFYATTIWDGRGTLIIPEE